MSENLNTGIDSSSKTTSTEETPTGETIEKTVETTVTTKKIGFFGRIARALEARPITTSLGITGAASAAGFGAYNYRHHGSVLPAAMSSSDVADVARAAAGLFAGR